MTRDEAQRRAAELVQEYHGRRCWGYDPVQHAEYESLIADALLAAYREGAERATAGKGKTYDDEANCAHCGRYTPHTYHDSGHERDSINDWRQCHVCRWHWSGATGEYAPPTT